MKPQMTYIQARDALLERTRAVDTELVPLESAQGRVLAEQVQALEAVPPFDRSPYDGYALRAADTCGASPEAPAVLTVTQEIAAGDMPRHAVAPGTAAKILTGAPIPEGADCVVMFERTQFTAEQIKLFAPMTAGENIVRAGEDIAKGQCLAQAGTAIDAGVVGTLASQGIRTPRVYRRPHIGLISTGNEVIEPGMPRKPGHIYNSNRYTLTAALEKEGCRVTYLGLAGDRVESIAQQINRGLSMCDWVILTGGVSVGDYDLTPAAMEQAGVSVMIRGVDIKPGMACAYGVQGDKLVCGLSGNPASSIANFYAVLLPALRKLCGHRQPIPREIMLTLKEGFAKKSKVTRLLRGQTDFTDGTVKLHIPQNQGNVIISSTIGCDAVAVVPAGSEPLVPGCKLKGFLV